jgi:hypothetical protein
MQIAAKNLAVIEPLPTAIAKSLASLANSQRTH